MEKIKVIFDKKGNTLNVWFKDPKEENICEETGDEVILVKNKAGEIIGFEMLNFLKRKEDLKKIEVEGYVT